MESVIKCNSDILMWESKFRHKDDIWFDENQSDGLGESTVRFGEAHFHSLEQVDVQSVMTHELKSNLT